MERAIKACLLGALVCYGPVSGAVTVSWVNASGDYVGGESVGPWSILEYKDAVTGNGNGAWSVTGGWEGSYLGFPSSLMWTYTAGSTASTTFVLASNAVAFMLNSDGNDGMGTFFVDGSPVFTVDMQSIPNNHNATLVFSDLPFTRHTIAVESGLNPINGLDDLHLYGAAAVSAVPVPGALWLLGSGLAGLAGIRARRSN